MLSRNQIKFISSLQQKKFRRHQQMFVAEGPKIVMELLESKFQVEAVYALPAFADSHMLKSRLGKVDLNIISEKDLQRISGLKTPNEVIALVKIPEQNPDYTALFDDLLLYLDNLQDPGNLGTIIRTADWFGIKNIVCSPDTVEVYSPKIVQASMGSIIRVNVIYEELKTLLKQTSEQIPIYATVLNGENIYKYHLKNKGIIIIGNESKGVSSETASLANYRISIPSAQKKSGPESLNASVAAALVMAEFRRQSV